MTAFSVAPGDLDNGSAHAIVDTIDELMGAIGRLISDRQMLRSHGVDPDTLEENRVAIVRHQHELSRAFIARYRPGCGVERGATAAIAGQSTRA